MSESISKKEEIDEFEGMGEDVEEKKDDYNIDLNDQFNYTLDDEDLGFPSPMKKSSSPNHHLGVSSTISEKNSEESGERPQLNNFEKLLQNKNLFDGMSTQLTQSHPPPACNSTSTTANQPTDPKNFFDQIQDCHEEYFLTTQVDLLKPLRRLNDLQSIDFISTSLIGSRETSLQACVAMLFGFKLNELSQNGGLLPPLSAQDPAFENQLDQWISLNTHCSSHLIPFSILRDSSLGIQGGRLCILYGMVSNSSKHCFVGYLEVNTSSRTPQVRCLLDPSDPDCIDDGHEISQNAIQLDLIEWVLCFTDANDRESSFDAHNHHTEVLSLEESGLFTQEEHHEHHKPQAADPTAVDRDQEATDSYLRLAQSTVEHDPSSLHHEMMSSSDHQILEKPSPMQQLVPEEPTEIIPVEEMTNFLNPRPECPRTPPRNANPISLALSPSEDESSDSESSGCEPAASELEPTEIISCPSSPQINLSKKPLLGFSPTQHVEEEENHHEPDPTNSQNSSGRPHSMEDNSDQVQIEEELPAAAARTHITLGFSQSQDEVILQTVPAKKKVLLGFTQTQRIEEPQQEWKSEKEGDKDNFIYLSHMTGETQYTISTYPSQSQMHLSLMQEDNEDRIGAEVDLQEEELRDRDREVIELSGDTPVNSSILLPNPSLETVPSIQSNRREERSSDPSSALTGGRVPSEGWITSKKILRETYPVNEEATQSDDIVASKGRSPSPSPQHIPRQEDFPVPQQSAPVEVAAPVDVSEILRKLQEKERELEARESLLKKREQEIALAEKQKVLIAAPAPPPCPQETTAPPGPASKSIQPSSISSAAALSSSSSSCFTEMNRVNSLSQGGVQAVDGLLQLKHAPQPNSSEPELPIPSNSSKSPIGSRFQWSSIQKLPLQIPDDSANEPSPQSSKLIRRKVGAIVDKPTKTSLNKTFDFESSSPEEPPIPKIKTKTNKPSKPFPPVSTPASSSSPPAPALKTNSRVDGSEECEWNSQEDVARISSRLRATVAESSSFSSSSSSSKPLNPIPNQETQDALSEVLPYDIPLSLRYQEDINALKWVLVWKDLNAVGWHWQRGRGLVDFAYCRPGKNYQLGIGEEGLDYFTTEDAVIQFLLSKALVRSPPPPPAAKARPPTHQPNQVENIIPFSQTDSETTGKIRQKRKLVDPPAREVFEVEDDLPDPAAAVAAAASLDSLSWKNEIQTLPWPELWRNLQAEGWTWDYGSGLVLTWYLKPGVEKRAKGVHGESAFGSEDEVRRYLIKELDGGAPGEGSKRGKAGERGERGEEIASEDEESSEEETNWRNGIQTLPWPELWRNLQGEGWTWDHGSGLVARWYLRPGIGKPGKGIRGVSVFGSEEEVRNHLKGLKKESDKSKAEDEEEEEEEEGSDDWELVKHRKKRKASTSSAYRSYHQNSRDFYAAASASSTSHSHNQGNRNDQFVRTKHQTRESKHISKKARRQHLSYSEFEESTQQQDLYHADLDSDSREGPSDLEIQTLFPSRRPFAGHRTERRAIIHCPQDLPPVSTPTVHSHLPSPDTSRTRTEATPEHLLKHLQAVISPKLTSLSSTTPTTSPSSSSSNSHQTKKRTKGGVISAIFSTLKFFFTGVFPPYDRKKLMLRVREKGGSVVTEERLLEAIRTGLKKELTVVIACPSGYRRPNFIVALAAGLPLVHPQWIEDSIASQSAQPLPLDQYVIPLGSSVLHPYFIFRKQTPAGGVFNHLRVLCCTDTIPDLWSHVIATAGGNICPNSDEEISKYRSCILSFSRSNHLTVPLPDFVIVDSATYAEGKLDHLKADFIEQCMSLLHSQDNRWQSIPKIVTTEWAAYCLGMGEITDPTLHGVFTLPSDRIRNSRVLRIPELGRFVVGDTVYFSSKDNLSHHGPLVLEGAERFSCSQLCHRQHLERSHGLKDSPFIGKISSFVRRTATDPVQVKVHPLRIRCVECETQQTTGAKPAGGRGHHTYELSMESNDGEIILSTAMLSKNYPTVLSSSAYQTCAYRHYDPTVYTTSPEWEGAMAYGTDSELSQEDPQKQGRHHLVSVQQSQDY